MVVECFEEFHSLLVVRVPSPRRVRLAGPVDSDVLSVTFHERIPILRIPSIVQCFHQPQILFNTHSQDLPPSTKQSGTAHCYNINASARGGLYTIRSL